MNIAYFHRIASGRRVNTITSIKVGDLSLSSEEDIGRHARDFYFGRFTKDE